MGKNSIERIKQEVDLVETVHKYGVELKKEGKNLVGLCPFHSEKTASFKITPAKKVWHCFGCGKGGSVIDFIMEAKGWDLPTTLLMLQPWPSLNLPLVLTTLSLFMEA